MISWRMAAAWLVALVAATVLTWQIVGLADSQVGESPMAVAPMLTTEDTASTTSSMASPSTEDRRTTSTTASATTSTSDSGSETSTSSSPSSAPSTSSTAWSIRSVTTTGGVVVLSYRPDEVELQAATPAPGYAVEIDDPGPPRVRVEFESDDDDVRVEARWDNGGLDIDVDQG